MTAVGQRVGARVGHRVGVTMGRAGVGLASYLPTLYGSAPIWHAGSTTPNADGAISAIADVSLGLYPLSQGTGGNQPTRGGGKVTYATNDYMGSTDATLCAWGDGRNAVTVAVIAECNAGTPSANEALIGFGNSGTANNYLRMVHDTSDRLLAGRGNGAGGEVAATSAAGITSTRRAYIATYAGGASDTINLYQDGAVIAGPATGAVAVYTCNQFALGCLWRTTAASFANASIVVAFALPRVATAGEIAAWTAYKDAGCPL